MNYSNIYPDLSEATAPVMDEFDTGLLDISSATRFCRLIHHLFREENVSHVKESTIIQRHSDSLNIPLYLLSTPSPTIINNNVINVPQTTKEVKKEEKEQRQVETYDLAMHLGALAITAVVVPATVWLVSSDYSAYQTINELDEIYEKVKKARKRDSYYGSSQRVRQFTEIVQSWKKIRKQIRNDILSSMKQKAVGGTGTLCLGIGIILGSTVGIWSGGLALIGAGSYYLWRKATDRPEELKSKIISDSSYFLQTFVRIKSE